MVLKPGLKNSDVNTGGYEIGGHRESMVTCDRGEDHGQNQGSVPPKPDCPSIYIRKTTCSF